MCVFQNGKWTAMFNAGGSGQGSECVSFTSHPTREHSVANQSLGGILSVFLRLFCFKFKVKTCLTSSTPTHCLIKPHSFIPNGSL